MQENPRNWGMLERSLGVPGGVAEPRYTSMPDMCYHVKFRSSATKCVRILHYITLDFKAT